MDKPDIRYCSKCHEALGLEGEPEINPEKVFKNVLKENGDYLNVGVCECCSLCIVANIDGELKVQTLTSDWQSYDDDFYKYYIKNNL